MSAFTSALSLCILLTVIFEAVKGQGNVASNNRITNGDIARYTPTFMVSIQLLVKSKQTSSHLCAGVFVDTNMVLTVASCLLYLDPKEIIVRAGTTDLSSSLGSSYNVVDYRLIPTPTVGIDFAVIKINTAITPGARISVANLTADSNIEAGDAVLLYGYGFIDPSGRLPSTKNQVLITKVLPNHECTFVYPTLDVNNALCTYIQPGKGACLGDEGGPVVLLKTGKLIALISTVYLPCGGMYPSIITLIGGHLDLIKSMIKELSRDASKKP